MRDMGADRHWKREGTGYGPEQPRQSLESAESDVPTGIRSGDSSDSLRLGYWNQETMSLRMGYWNQEVHTRALCPPSAVQRLQTKSDDVGTSLVDRGGTRSARSAGTW